MKMVPLGEVLTFAGTPERISRPATEKFVTVRLNCGGAVQRTVKDGKVPVAFTGYRVNSGQFLYSRIDARNGAYALVPDALDGAVVSKDFPVFDIRDDIVDRRYLLHFLRAGRLQPQIRAVSFGATNRQRIAEDRFLAFKFPLQPLDEQRRIAAILDQADDLRAARHQILTHLDTLGGSLFTEMFGSGNYQTAELSEVVRPGTIVTYGIVQAGPEVDGGVPYVRTGDIIGGAIRTTGLRHTAPSIAAKFERSRVGVGDIVMSIRATVGTTALVPPELDGANLTQGTAKISPSVRATGPYLLHYLRSPGAQRWIQAQVKGATFREITLGALRQLPVPLAPLPLQEEFSHRLRALTETRLAAVKSSASLNDLFVSLQSRAFSGQL